MVVPFQRPPYRDDDAIRERVAANLDRLATARQYGGQHAEAAAMFREAVALTTSGAAADYEDFALQHLGTCLVEMNRADEALACFDRALVLRRPKADPELIASTEAARAAVRSRDAPSE